MRSRKTPRSVAAATASRSLFLQNQTLRHVRHKPLSRLRAFMHLDRGPGLVLRMAQWLDGTIRTLRLPRDAQIPSMVDDLVRIQNPALRRNDFHQVLLNLDRIIVLREFP